MQEILSTIALNKIYAVDGVFIKALQNINLNISMGVVCAIVGPSGSGKSTLLHHLSGIEKPSSGTINLLGEDITKMDENALTAYRKQRVGFIFQNYNLLPQYTALENVAFPLVCQGWPKQLRERAAANELRRIGLANRMGHMPNQLSGGQQQRVGIARAFVSRPKVIFADEPTGNLDSTSTIQTLKLMLSLSQQNDITFVMVTHDKEIAACANHVIEMGDGKILREYHQNNTETVMRINALSTAQ